MGDDAETETCGEYAVEILSLYPHAADLDTTQVLIHRLKGVLISPLLEAENDDSLNNWS